MTPSTIIRWCNPKVILVATSLVEDETFMLHAIYQAEQSRAKVLLVHVIPPFYLRSEAVYGTPLVQPAIVVRNAREKMEAIVAEFQWKGIDCEPIILNGLPEEQIPVFVKSRIVDRVIVSERNASGVERLIGGSVAEAVISTIEIPVCTIGRRMPPGPVCANSVERILLATSLHPESLMLARFASTLAELHHAQLTLLHVLDPTGMTDQDRELLRFKARKRLSSLIPKEARHRHETVILIPEGDPTAIIPDAAGSMLQDLVILGGPAPSLLSWILGTSLVHRVVLEARCPVITIKSHADGADERPFLLDAVDADPMRSRSIECIEGTVASR